MKKLIKLDLSFLLFLLALFTAVFVCWRQNGYPKTGIDDSNIFFSYAENLAHGRGFVYANNPEPVEGFTSMLWTLLCATSFALRANEAGIFALAILLLVGTQWLCWRLMGRILEERAVQSLIPHAFYAVGVLSSCGYVMWTSITLMDVALWGFFLAWGATVLYETSLIDGHLTRSNILTGTLLFTLAPLVRPEFMVAFPGLLGLLFLRNFFLRCPFLHLVVWSGAFLIALGGLTVFRWQYFGYPLPNTFYAKVSPSIAYNLDEGIQYALSFFTSNMIGMFFCATLAGWVAMMGIRACWRIGLLKNTHLPALVASDLLLPWVAGLCCLPVLAGGDHFAYSRFYEPIWPLICLGCIVALPATFWNALSNQPWKTYATTAIFAMLPLGTDFSVSWFRSHWQRLPATHEFEIAARGVRTGLLLNEVFSATPQLPNLGIITAGGIARTWDGPLTDLMGLNDIVVAHFPGERKGKKTMLPSNWPYFLL